MPGDEVKLTARETLLRVYTRLPSQKPTFQKILSGDFARNIKSESGITLIRYKDATKQQALNTVDTLKLKGLAACKGKALQVLGLRFYANPQRPSIISVRCAPCNLDDGEPRHCEPLDYKPCMFDINADYSLPVVLAQLFKVDTIVATNKGCHKK